MTWMSFIESRLGARNVIGVFFYRRKCSGTLLELHGL